MDSVLTKSQATKYIDQIAKFLKFVCKVPNRLGQKYFFVNFEIFGRHIWWKKRGNYNKFKNATNCANQIFNLKAFFFFLLTGAT